MGDMAKGKSGMPVVIRGTKIPQMYNCVELPDITFEFDKSYIRPEYAAHLEQDVNKLKTSSPADARLFVFGHTDAVGFPSYNKLLSDRRAQSLVNFVTHGASEWVKLHEEENWNAKIVLATLSVLDPSRMKLPVGAYVSQKGEIKDKKLLEHLYKDYMEQNVRNPLDIKKDFCREKSCVGCSELNPLVEASKSTDKPIRDSENQPNRRSVIFAFEENAVFPCRLKSMAPCNRHKYRSPAKGTGLFTCEFYDRMIQKGKCPDEKDHPPKSKPPAPAPQPSQSIAVYLGYPECTVDAKILRNHPHDPVLWTKMMEVLEVNADGSVVAYLNEEIETAKSEKNSSTAKKATFLVKTTLTHDGTNYILKASVVKRDSGELLFDAAVKAPRLIGVEGYWERTGKNVWRHVRSGASPRPEYESKYLQGLGIDNYRNDLMLLLCVDRKSGWKEYPNITKRVEAEMQARGYKIVD